MRRTLPLIVALALGLLAATGCGAEEEAAPPPPPPPAEPAPPPAPEPPPEEEAPDDEAPEEEEPETEGPAPVGPAGTGEVATDDFPNAGRPIAYLRAVRAAGHEAGADHPPFDRVVLEFQGPRIPTWRVTYVEPPIQEDPSGEPIDVAGEAFIEIRLEPASGVDLTAEEPQPTYVGPARLPVPNANVATEVARVGDFEANLAWVVGVERPAPFAVRFFRDPLRLVLDILDTAP